MVGLFCIIVADDWTAVAQQRNPYMSRFLKPVVVLVLDDQMRNYFMKVLKLFYTSSFLIFVMIVFVMLYSFAMYFGFKDTFQGLTFF
jgi:hypothetical protein